MSDLDPHKDTPVEILHTVLLGVVKYIWYETMQGLNSKQESVFQARLASINEDSLHITPIRANYIVQYKGGLIGRQFKDLAQIMVFTLYDDLVDSNITQCWIRLGWFMTLVWYPRIENIDIYCVSVKYIGSLSID